MLTEISPRALPAPTGATTELDHAIVRVLKDGNPREPRAIFEEIVRADPSFEAVMTATLQRVHARLRVLVGRGVLTRKTASWRPQRGPGAGVYTVA